MLFVISLCIPPDNIISAAAAVVVVVNINLVRFFVDCPCVNAILHD